MKIRLLDNDGLSYLIEHYATIDNQQMARRLQLSGRQIQYLANRMGLRKEERHAPIDIESLPVNSDVIQQIDGVASIHEAPAKHGTVVICDVRGGRVIVHRMR